jgi:hypothetical protein
MIRHYRKRRRITQYVIALLLKPIYASRAYPAGCSNQPMTYYDYDSMTSFDTIVRSHEEFLIIRRLGVGKFSDVFEAVDLVSEKSYSATMSAWDRKSIDPTTLCVIKVRDDDQKGSLDTSSIHRIHHWK